MTASPSSVATPPFMQHHQQHHYHPPPQQQQQHQHVPSAQQFYPLPEFLPQPLPAAQHQNMYAHPSFNPTHQSYPFPSFDEAPHSNTHVPASWPMGGMGLDAEYHAPLTSAQQAELVAGLETEQGLSGK